MSSRAGAVLLAILVGAACAKPSVRDSAPAVAAAGPWRRAWVTVSFDPGRSP